MDVFKRALGSPGVGFFKEPKLDKYRCVLMDPRGGSSLAPCQFSDANMIYRDIL